MDLRQTAPRAVRAAFFTACVVLLSVASHVLLSAAPLPLPTVAAVAAAVFALAYAFAGRARGFAGTAALFVPLELAADTVFTAGQHACYGAAGGPVTGPLRSVGLDLLCGTSVGTRLAGMAGQGGLGPDGAGLLARTGPATPWLLLAAHVAVGLLATAWLRRGERAVATLLRAAAVGGFRPLLLAVATARARLLTPRRPLRATAPRHGRVLPVRSRLWVHSVGRRGPPYRLLPTG